MEAGVGLVVQEDLGVNPNVPQQLIKGNAGVPLTEAATTNLLQESKEPKRPLFQHYRHVWKPSDFHQSSSPAPKADPPVEDPMGWWQPIVGKTSERYRYTSWVVEVEPILKNMIQSKMGIFFRGENKKCLKPPRKKCCKIDFVDGNRWSEQHTIAVSEPNP